MKINAFWQKKQFSLGIISGMQEGKSTKMDEKWNLA